MASFANQPPRKRIPNPPPSGARLQWALRTRETLLARRPDLRAFQEEIDRLLAGAGDAGNRRAVLEFLMEAHLMRLKQTLTALSDRLSETRCRTDKSHTERRRSE